MLKVLTLNIFLFFHPVHVTLTTINQVHDSDTLKVFFRMYYDDFQRDYKLYYPEFKPGKNNDTTGIPREMLNKYFNDSEPWKTKKSNPEQCAATLYVSLQVVRTLAILLAPVIPFTADKIWKLLKMDSVLYQDGWDSAADRKATGSEPH